MPVYDLDKTQEWLDRTMAIRREPPLRGGVKTDHKARRQTLAGLGVVASVILVLALIPHRTPAPASLQTAAAPVILEPATPAPAAATAPSARRSDVAATWQPSPTPRLERPLPDTMQQPLGTYRGPGYWDNRVAPPAPTWLDGQEHQDFTTETRRTQRLR